MKTLIKIGGTLLEDAASRAGLARQIAPLQSTAVVHGGGKQMTRFLDERGVASHFVRGLRVTGPETIDAVVKVIAGSINTQLVGALAVEGARGVGLTGVDAGIATAVQMAPELGFVGLVTKSDTSLLDALTGAGYLPVIACVAGGEGGQVFNVNGDSLAVAVAKSWSAGRLIFLTDVAGVMDADKAVLSTLTAEDCRSLIETGVAAGGMQAKLNAAIEAVEGGVQEVRIVKGSEADIVTRVLSGETVGTRIVR